MSSWPPPQHPTPAPQQPVRPIQPAPARGGCGKALAITLLLTLVTLVFAALLGSTDTDYIPVIEDSVGVIRIEDAIMESEDTVKLIRKMRENSMIKALVLRLETPGGGVAASEEIYREALKARTEDGKLVVVSMGAVAASGGYYIAAAADHIYATSGTVTGSIGVISPMFNASGTLDKLGLEEDSIATGEHKDTGSPFDQQTTTERALIQGVVNDMYRQFCQVVLQARHKPIAAAVADGRLDAVLNAAQTKADGGGIEWSTFTTGTVASAIGVPVETETALRRLADGRIYTGEQALQVGLVDSIGTLQDAIDFAGQESGLGVDPPTVDRNPGKRDVSSWLGSSVRRFVQEATAPSSTIEFRSRF